jgi:hypothetical protein
MKMKQIKIIIVAFIVLTFCVSSSHAKTSEKESVLRTCAELFGPSVDQKQSLFEVNQLFVLQPKFNSVAELVELSVLPKYNFQESHPEWTEPDHISYLSHANNGYLLSRLDTVKSKGNMIKSMASGAVTNSTHYFLDQYEQAFLLRGEWADLGVRFFSLLFLHEIEGKITKKRKYEPSLSYYTYGNGGYSQVTVGDSNHFVREDDYRKLKVGRVEKLLAVGPLDGF